MVLSHKYRKCSGTQPVKDYDLCERCYETPLAKPCDRGHAMTLLGLARLQICLSVRPPVRRSMSAPVCPSVWQSGCLSLPLFLCGFLSHSLSVSLSPSLDPVLNAACRDNGWGCDGRSQPGGCKRGITGFRQTKGIHRFRCEAVVRSGCWDHLGPRT